VALLLPIDDDEVAGPFWAGTAAGELRYQTCADCGRYRHPPRPMCPYCRSLADTWVAAKGTGTIWSFVIAHPPLLPDYAEQAPYNVAVITLDEDPGLRMVGNVVRTVDGPIGELGPDDLTIGDPVRVVFPEPVDGVVIPRWVPAG
jgi:uncharacterized OB-fold protein